MKLETTWKAEYKFGLVFLATVILDQITKFAILSNLESGNSIEILPFFSITYVKNTGISFGLLQGNNVIFILVALAVLVYFFYDFLKTKKFPYPYGLFCAGILGNLIDRILHGFVVDFVHFHFFPIFNVADMAISAGVVWLIWKSRDS